MEKIVYIGWVWILEKKKFISPPKPRVGDIWIRNGKWYKWGGLNWKFMIRKQDKND